MSHALRAAPFSPAHCSSRQPRRARPVRCQATEANAEGFDAQRRGVLGVGAAVALGSLLELGGPQRAGAKVVSSDWELVRLPIRRQRVTAVVQHTLLSFGQLGVPVRLLVLRCC